MGLLSWRSLQVLQQKSPLKPSHMGFTSLCIGLKIKRQQRGITQVETPITCRDQSWSLTISHRISSSGPQPRNWLFFTSITCRVVNKSYTVKFIREVTIPPNWTYLVKCILKISAPENINLKYTCFTPDLEDDLIKTPRHKMSIVPNKENKNNIPASFPSRTNVHEGLPRKKAWTSDPQKNLVKEGVRGTSNPGIFFAKNPSSIPSGIPSSEGDKGSSEYKKISKCLILSIHHQKVFGGLRCWIITPPPTPTPNMFHLRNYN